MEAYKAQAAAGGGHSPSNTGAQCGFPGSLYMSLEDTVDEIPVKTGDVSGHVSLDVSVRIRGNCLQVRDILA